MLHILWVILRTILIILAVLVGLVLLILLTVLFCPIRYQGSGRKDDNTLMGKVRLSWLFGAVSGNISYVNGKQEFIIRILGIALESYQRFFGKVKGLFAGRKTGKKKAKKMESEETESKPESEETGSKQEVESTESKMPVSAFRKFVTAITKFFQQITSIPIRIWKFFRRIALTIKGICVNIKQWKMFLEDERVRGAIGIGKDQLIVLLKHIAPRKVKGYVTFGFEDPSITGQVLAVIGVTCPIHKNAVTIQPVFTGKVLEADVQLRGRLYLFMLLKIGIRLYFDENIKYMMKAMKRKEG